MQLTKKRIPFSNPLIPSIPLILFYRMCCPRVSILIVLLFIYFSYFSSICPTFHLVVLLFSLVLWPGFRTCPIHFICPFLDTHHGFPGYLNRHICHDIVKWHPPRSNHATSKFKPPDAFTLQSGDLISIEIDGIGQLQNTVAWRFDDRVAD